jgi:hypothetical protein
MGIWTEAVLLYGIPIPNDHECASRYDYDDELIDSILNHHDGVSHATAGPYDHHTRYIVTDYYSVDMGRYADPLNGSITLAPFDIDGITERGARLEHAAMELDITAHPAWYLIASQS